MTSGCSTLSEALLAMTLSARPASYQALIVRLPERKPPILVPSMPNMEVHHFFGLMDQPEGFPTEVAARLGGVTLAMLANWVQTRFISPSVPAKRRGVSRRYSFRDIVAIRVASQLRDEGMSLQGLRKVVKYLCARKGLSATEVLASTNLVTDGRDVYEVAGDVSISTLRRPGQRMLLMVPLDELVTELQAKARALRVA